MRNGIALIERLESRIAPAAVYVYTDVDGDKVTVTSSKGNSSDLQNIFQEHAVAQGSGYRINEIDLTDVTPGSMGEFADTNLTISVQKGPHGDGRVDLGAITSGTMPIGSIIAPKASIQQLVCGDGTHGIGTLVIGSYGTSAPAYFNNGISDSPGLIDGSVGAIRIAGDIAYGGLNIETSALGAVPSVGSIFVGGSLDGAVSDATTHAGYLAVSAGKIGSVTIRGNIIGGTISTGVSDNGSGVLDVAPAANTGDITIDGNIVGGTGAGSGSVNFLAASFVVGGSVIGGSNGLAGTVTGYAHTVGIRGSVIGGVTDGAAYDPAGSLVFPAAVNSLTVHGNLISGSVTGGTQNINGAIIVGEAGSITVGGSMIGNNANRALILVEGEGLPVHGIENAVNSVSIGGSVDYGVIASGHTEGGVTTANLGAAVNPNAGIGRVTIGGDFYHSSILAGTNDNNGFGAGRITAGVNDDTQSIGAGELATLGPVFIRGAILDDYSATGDSGFEAAKIVSITAGGALLFTHGEGLTYFDPNDFVFADEITPT